MPAALRRARALGVETCGRIASFWGFTRTMGRIFGLLYLSPEPLGRPQIQRRLGISVGNASMTLGALKRWGVVHHARVKGQRASHYTAETDFWKMISRVLDERERREIATAVELVESAQAQAARARDGGGGGDGKAGGARDQAGGTNGGPAGDGAPVGDAAFVAERLDRLHDICTLGQTMLDTLLGQLKLDVGRFRHVLRVPAPGLAPAQAQDTAPTGRARRGLSGAATKPLPPR